MPEDGFPCCGGNDEHPPDHCMDCPARSPGGDGSSGRKMAFLYDVEVKEVTVRTLVVRVEAANWDEAVALGKYELAHGGSKPEESVELTATAKFVPAGS